MSRGRVVVATACAMTLYAVMNVSKNDMLKDNPLIVRPKFLGANSTTRPIQLINDALIHEYRKTRNDTYDSWFEPGGLLPNADKNGLILDFFIAGFAKCGTTTMEANLGYIAPMPIGDICTPSSNTVFYAYISWPKKYGKDKLLRGSKCPFFSPPYLADYSAHLPRTKLIVGIRHPILWFQSFWNMQKKNKSIKENDDPMDRTQPCIKRKVGCKIMCPNQLFCLHRGRFHVALAEIGKTALSEDERKLLAPNDFDGGMNLKSSNIRNPIFLYEQSELSKDYIWDELATYLNVASIPHNKTHSGAVGATKAYNRTNFCEGRYDNFRAMMMPYAYELSVWLKDYFIPVARNESSDVTIPNIDAFTDLVASYEKDPCNRLYRLSNGTYVLDPDKGNTIEVTYT